MSLSRPEKIRRLRILQEEAEDLEQELFGRRDYSRVHSLNRNNRRWMWIKANAQVIWTDSGEGIVSFVVRCAPKLHLSNEEAVTLLVDRGISEGWQPSNTESQLDFNCPNLLVGADGEPTCRLCSLPKSA